MSVKKQKAEWGFSLIEVLVVLVFLIFAGYLLAPKIKVLIYTSREGRTKASLGQLRGALAIYYSDNKGLYPSDIGTPETRLRDSLVPKYIHDIPYVDLRHHHPKRLNTVQDRLNDRGDWFYTTLNGFVGVNCTHKDTKKKSISEW